MTRIRITAQIAAVHARPVNGYPTYYLRLLEIRRRVARVPPRRWVMHQVGAGSRIAAGSWRGKLPGTSSHFVIPSSPGSVGLDAAVSLGKRSQQILGALE